MKKNWTMRVGALMLALTLITSCFVGGTFAKYVTSGVGENEARVAKFGVNVVSTGGMFSSTYATHDPNADTDEITTNSVIAYNDTDKLVAPGTNGALADVAITGRPEVAVRVENTVTDMKLEGWTLEDNTTFYCPLIFTFGVDTDESKEVDTRKVIDGKDYDNAEDLIAAVKAAVAEFKKEYKANTDLSTVENAGLVITWEWPFETEGNDAKDTALGDKAAANNAAEVSIDITTTVTQID